MIIFGTRSSQIAKLEVGDTTCNYCNQQGTQEVSVYGRYFHIFWIPILPMDKKVYSECTHCKKTIEQKDFPPDLKQKYQAVAPTAKRPIWHSLGILLVGGFFGLMLFFGILSSLFGKRTPPDPRAEAFKADMAQLSGSPSMQSDSLSFKLKMQLDKISKLDPENFEYFTKTMDDKLLVLVKIPTLKKLG